MKLRKLILASGVILALSASFAFKSAKKADAGQAATFWVNDSPSSCANGNMDPFVTDCDLTNSGAQCTVYDWVSFYNPGYVPAYADINGSTPCYYPLNHQF